ncbi:MAG: metallophosphoesterase family protein [Promethearchaeota archaeon]
MEIDTFLDLSKGTFPIIINPNIGQPTLINLNNLNDDFASHGEKITFNAMVIAMKSHSVERILEHFHSNLFIQPILKDHGNFLERRGEKYPLRAIEIKKIDKIDLKEQSLLTEENCVAMDIYKTALKIKGIYGKRNALFEVIYEISRPIINNIIQILNKSNRKIILFDIIHDIPNMNKSKINYHSLAMFNKDWANFKFIHATDLHIARRNDFIINYIRDKKRKEISRCRNNEKKIEKVEKFVLDRDFEFREGFQDDRYEDLKYAKYNCNYQLRKLISFVNKKVSNDECDFVIFTGDIVDYVKIAKGNKSYKNNFEVFIDILLGLNKGLAKPPFLGNDEEFINKSEILIPIFTIAGNHDFHMGHYGMRFMKFYEKFGLTRSDIKGYNDIKLYNYYLAFHSTDNTLKDYLRYINPNLNYKIKIGNYYNFIFLDTGHDSVADLHDLLKGGPSTKGFKDYQMDLLRSYIQLSHNEKIIILMHAPPISPNISSNKKRTYKKKFKIKNRTIEWSDFYEENLKNLNETGRVDRILNFKYQTVMYNWATFMKIITGSDEVIRRKIDMVLCGHTHSLKEYRLKETKENEIINYGFWLLPLYITVPCEIYTSRYRDVFKTIKDPKNLQIWFDVNKPFIFQTQALGPLSASYKFKPPGFRYISISDNQISKVDVYSLHLK